MVSAVVDHKLINKSVQSGEKNRGDAENPTNRNDYNVATIFDLNKT